MAYTCTIGETFILTWRESSSLALVIQGSQRLQPFRVLQGMLHSAAPPEAAAPGQTAEPEAVREIAADESLQLSLLTCAAEVVTFATASHMTFPEVTWKLSRLDQVLGLWHAIGLFWSHLSGSGQHNDLPGCVQHFLTFMRCVSASACDLQGCVLMLAPAWIAWQR